MRYIITSIHLLLYYYREDMNKDASFSNRGSHILDKCTPLARQIIVRALGKSGICEIDRLHTIRRERADKRRRGISWCVVQEHNLLVSWVGCVDRETRRTMRGRVSRER